MKIDKDGVVQHDNPDLQKGLKRAVRNIPGNDDIKIKEVAKRIGVPTEMVYNAMRKKGDDNGR
ncbi:MAG: hypothetical protein MN733_08830 [Nitrososphaera sp.]|nr:hypothetical protein [Nitrososphaera sp.]